uniref:fibronectin type III domain-containing protein n=1 Tax=Treponema sp. TaxID=166 RepID=UPI0025FA18D1
DYDGTALESVTAEAGTTSADFTSLSASTTYSFTVTAYDAFGNSTAVSVTANTAEDTTAPEDVSGLAAAAGRTSVTLTWTASTSEDVYAYAVYVDDSTEAYTTVTDATATVSDLTTDTEYSFTVKAVDYDSNESTGVSVTATPAIPAPSNAVAEVKYTGSVLVTWDDTTAVEDGITYSYTVSCSDSTVDSITGVISGETGAHFTDLTVGTAYTFTVTLVDSNDVTCGTATTDSVTAATVILKIGNGYRASGTTVTRYLAWGSSSSSTTCYNTGAVADSAEPTASYWIIRPALSGTDGYFSLEAATGTTGVGTGYFLYVDENDRDYVAYNGTWGNGGWSNYVMVATTTGVENDGTSYITDASQASFYWGTSSWNSSYSRMYSESMSGYYVCHASLTFGVTNSSSEDSNGCAAFIIDSSSTAAVDYYSDGAPSAVTNLAAGTATTTTIPLTWTDPSNADLGFVRISYTADSVTSTVDVDAGEGAVTLSGLTKGTSYSITATAYDVYGNASDATDAITAETLDLTNIPTNVAATARFTGEILVTWDRAEDDTDSSWQYKVECSDDDVTAQSFTSLTSYAGTYADAADGVAQFTGLTSDTTYTFTVYASEDGETWNSDETVSATAATMTKQIWNTLAYSGSGQYNCELNTTGSANLLCCQYSTGGGNATWYIYPALDGTITVTHTVTNSSSETVSADYDTFSIYHTSKGYATLAIDSMTETSATALSNYVSCSTATTSDSTGASTFFFGYNSTSSAYTLRLNVTDENYAIGFAKTGDNATEILYYNDATSATCESSGYAWYFYE